MTITMAITITTPTTSLLHSSSSSSSSPTVGRTSCLCSLSSLSISIPKNAIFQRVKCIPQLGFTPLPQWSGLKQMGFSILPSSFKIGKKGKGKGKGVCASLFGVGAPEVLVIGVVALLVFGPKGLAEVARNLGKTLREFQPTIRELQEVSREFKSTLEREIGLDDIDNPAPKSSSSDTAKPKSEDAPADPETKIEPNGSSGNEEESGVKVRADSFLGALAQLQKEQAEAEQQKIIEKENEAESETSQSQPESQTPSQDTPEALDDSQEATSVTSTENLDNNALQEADSVTTTASDNPKNNALQEAAPVVATGTATKTETET